MEGQKLKSQSKHNHKFKNQRLSASLQPTRDVPKPSKLSIEGLMLQQMRNAFSKDISQQV